MEEKKIKKQPRPKAEEGKALSDEDLGKVTGSSTDGINKPT